MQDRTAPKRLCCAIRNVTSNLSLCGLRSSHAHCLWHAQLRHPIECRTFHCRFDALSPQTPRPEAPPEQPREAEHGILGDTLPRVPTPSPPCSAPVCLDLL